MDGVLCFLRRTPCVKSDACSKQQAVFSLTKELDRQRLDLRQRFEAMLLVDPYAAKVALDAVDTTMTALGW